MNPPFRIAFNTGLVADHANGITTGAASRPAPTATPVHRSPFGLKSQIAIFSAPPSMLFLTPWRHLLFSHYHEPVVFSSRCQVSVSTTSDIRVAESNRSIID